MHKWLITFFLLDALISIASTSFPKLSIRLTLLKLSEMRMCREYELKKEGGKPREITSIILQIAN